MTMSQTMGATMGRTPGRFDRFKRWRVVAWHEDGFRQTVELCWTIKGAQASAMSYTQIAGWRRAPHDDRPSWELRYRAEAVV